jgi:hypothetical protein
MSCQTCHVRPVRHMSFLFFFQMSKLPPPPGPPPAFPADFPMPPPPWNPPAPLATKAVVGPLQCASCLRLIITDDFTDRLLYVLILPAPGALQSTKSRPSTVIPLPPAAPLSIPAAPVVSISTDDHTFRLVVSYFAHHDRPGDKPEKRAMALFACLADVAPPAAPVIMSPVPVVNALPTAPVIHVTPPAPAPAPHASFAMGMPPPPPPPPAILATPPPPGQHQSSASTVPLPPPPPAALNLPSPAGSRASVMAAPTMPSPGGPRASGVTVLTALPTPGGLRASVVTVPPPPSPGPTPSAKGSPLPMHDKESQEHQLLHAVYHRLAKSR